MNKYYVLALQELANSRREDRENDQAIWAEEMEGGENIYPEVSYEVSCVTRLKNWKNTNRTGYSHDTVWWMFLFRVSGQVNLNFSSLDPPANATVHLGDVASRFLLSRVDLPTSKWRAQSTVLPDLKDSHLCLLRQSEFTCRSPKLTTCCIQGFCCFFFFLIESVMFWMTLRLTVVWPCTSVVLLAVCLALGSSLQLLSLLRLFVSPANLP